MMLKTNTTTLAVYRHSPKQQTSGVLGGIERVSSTPVDMYPLQIMCTLLMS